MLNIENGFLDSWTVIIHRLWAYLICLLKRTYLTILKSSKSSGLKLHFASRGKKNAVTEKEEPIE
jgi:hypothetical protein